MGTVMKRSSREFGQARSAAGKQIKGHNITIMVAELHWSELSDGCTAQCLPGTDHSCKPSEPSREGSRGRTLKHGTVTFAGGHDAGSASVRLAWIAF